MITKVRVFSKDQMIDMLHEKKLMDTVRGNKVCVISIVDSDADELLPEHQNVLTLWFDDISPRAARIASAIDRPVYAMDKVDAENVLHYLHYWNKDDQYKMQLFIHCSAGVCRSGAVGRFATEYLGLDEAEFHKNNPNILPNKWVEDLLWSEAK